MARIHYVKKAQQRYEMVPTLDESGEQKIVPRMRKDGTPKVTKKGKEVVVRLTHADKTKPKPNLKCGKCGEEIKPGDPYKWVQPKTSVYGGSKRYRCMACPNWRESELSSSKMAGVYAAQEQMEDVLYDMRDVSDLEALRDDIADQIEGVADEYEEGANNIVDGFGHETMQSEEMMEKAEGLRGWAEDIRSVDFEEPEEEEEDEETAGIEIGDDEPDHFDLHWDDQQSKLADVVGDCPV